MRFGPIPGFDKVEVVGIGRDGTVLLHRSYYGIYPVDRESIFHDGVEVQLLAYRRPVFVSEYRDARNYAGSYYDPGDEPGATPPRTEPHAFVLEKGKTRAVGRGTVVAWSSGGAAATKVEVNERGEPAAWEDEKTTHIRIFEKDRHYDLGPLRFIGRSEKGAFVFAGQDSPDLYRWRSGRLTAWARLPKGWEPMTTDGHSGLLARKGTALAILRGRSLHPLRFPTPVVMNGLSWEGARSFDHSGKFQIELYKGVDATPFIAEFAPRRRSHRAAKTRRLSWSLRKVRKGP